MLFLRLMSNEHFPARLERLHSTFFLFKSVLEYITASCERQNGTVQRIKYIQHEYMKSRQIVSF